jgi:subtilisin-like proprotein convertase family protein
MTMRTHRKYNLVLKSALVALALDLCVPTRGQCALAGYFTDHNTISVGPAAVLARAGMATLQINDIATADLSAFDILFLDESDISLTSALQGRLAAIETWVNAGGRLIVHDRAVIQPNLFLLGTSGTVSVHTSGPDIDVIPPGGTLVTAGPFGRIDNSTLDGGSSSTHGYVLESSLPANSIPILSWAGDTNEVVALSYALGEGFVFYSTIPLDYYLDGSGSDPIRSNLANIYAPNVVAYVQSLSNGPTPPTIVTQPTSQRVTVGRSATFSISVMGTMPLGFFWQRDGGLISGATQPTYTINNVQTGDSGSQFSCLVSNAYGTVLSSNAFLTVVPASNMRVAIYGAGDSVVAQNDLRNLDVKAKLVATGLFDENNVDVYSAITPAPVPSLATLRQYNAILAYSNARFMDAAAFGNVLADYLDSGGGVVLATDAFSPDYGIAGRLQTAGYLPLTMGSALFSPAHLSLAMDLPGDPLLQSVRSLDSGANSFHNSVSLGVGATLVAHWNNGSPLIARKQLGDSRIVGLNFWPPSTDVDSYGWQTGTDGGRLMANALLWAANQAPTGVDHFVWDPIGPSQLTNVPFPVSITAKDSANTTVTGFVGSVSIRGSVPGGTVTNSIFGNAVSQWSGNNGSFTLGYAFTPNTNIQVTHVRHYSGNKVSIWNDGGTLLASQSVASLPGSWSETPLQTPITLSAGVRYRVAVYTAGTTYYHGNDTVSTFNHGRLDQSYQSAGDTFPSIADDDKWWLVDLRYRVGAAAFVEVTPSGSGSFSNGVWTGSLTVAQAATNLVLSADDGAGHLGLSHPFEVSDGASLVSFTNSAAITINDALTGDAASAATPYPSAISINELAGTMRDLTVTLHGFTHSYPHDVGVLLVGPKGQKIVLFANCGAYAVGNLTLTFDDHAPAGLSEFPPGPIASGSYKPSNCGSGDTGFPPNAPAGPYAAGLTICDGANPNGVWSLFVQDDSHGDSGIIPNGWSLSFSLIAPLPPPVILHQPDGQTVFNGQPARFSLTASGAQFFAWRMNGTNLTDQGRISGATTTDLLINDTKISDSGNWFSCVVGNASGSVTSSPSLLRVLAPSTPFFGAPAFLDGQFETTLYGAPLSNYVLYVSSDLTSWKPLRTVTTTGGSTNLFDLGTGLQRRFYRASLAP